MQSKFYVPGSSLLHVMHPSTKLVLYVVFFPLMSLLSWQIRWIVAGVAMVALWQCGVPPRRYRAFLWLAVPTLLTIPLLNGLLSNPGDTLMVRLVGGISLYRQGWLRGMDFSALYASLSISTVAWLTTTQMWEFPEALTRLGLPHMVGFVVGSILRYMPEVITHSGELADVQRSRGVDFSSGPLWERFWKQCLLMANLLLLELSRLRTKTNALEARGFSQKRRPTPFAVPAIPVHEKILMSASSVLVLLLSIGKLFHIGGS